MQDAPAKPNAAWRRWAVRLLKFAVVAAVLVFVGRTFSDALHEFTSRRLTIHPVPAFGSALLLLASQLPMAWFWRSTLLALGQPAEPVTTLIAYVVGQIGKYVPGKATVVLIRTERIVAAARRGRRPDSPTPSSATIAASVFYETLTHMAVGSLIAAGLTALLPLGESGWRAMLIGLSLLLAVACLTPTLPPVFAWLIDRVTRNRGNQQQLQRLSYGLAATGAAASAVSWVIVAAAAWLAARSVGAAADVGPGSFGVWVLAATLPVVAGFVSLLPAGVVVREAITLTVLSPLLGEADALATTIAFRVIWVGTEALVCGTLMGIGFIGRSRDRGQERTPP